MSNEQFSDCGTAYLSYEAHNKSMSYSTKTKLILLVAIMSIGPLSALRRRSVSSAMSYRPQDFEAPTKGLFSDIYNRNLIRILGECMHEMSM